MRKLTGQRGWVGRPWVISITGTDHGWGRASLSLMTLLGFASFRPTPVGSKVGDKQGCANTGKLYVLSPSSHLSYRRRALNPVFLLPKDFQRSLETDAIQGVDLYHQLSRLRHGKNLPDAEVELMMRTFAENLQTYDQVVEVGGS
jgi:hypothetical protein